MGCLGHQFRVCLSGQVLEWAELGGRAAHPGVEQVDSCSLVTSRNAAAAAGVRCSVTTNGCSRLLSFLDVSLWCLLCVPALRQCLALRGQTVSVEWVNVQDTSQEP